MSMNIRTGNPNKPPRVLIYGVEGVGKSTLGAKAPKPIFITAEGGSDRLKDANGNSVDQFNGIKNFTDVKVAVKSLTNESHNYQSVVLDSADWIEKLAHQQIVGLSNKTIITVNGGYGAGYRDSELVHKGLIDDLDVLREARNMNIIITAHAHVKQVKDPSMPEDYDSFEIKCHDMVSSLWREWVDALFFARFRTFVKSAESTDKARAYSDDTRVVYTQKQPSFQAKNRYGLPPEMNFTENFWNDFQAIAKNDPKTELAAMQTEMNALWETLPDPATKELVRKTVMEAGQDPVKLTAIYNRLKDISGKR